MKYFLGIDWGGTYIKAGLVNAEGSIVKKIVYTSADLSKKDLFIKKIESLVKDVGLSKIKGIGIGVPGIVDIKEGFIYYLPNIKGWKNYPLKKNLEKRIKLPISINNDANAFALAESYYGAGRGKARAIFLTLGTGLGGAIIYNGTLVRGRTSALELGHVPISLEGQLCGCGSKGCIETYVGNAYLLKRYKKLKGNKTKVKGIKEIYEKALDGEKQALKVWEEFSHALGKFLSGMINVFNPQVIIFGGGVSGAFKVFKPMLEKTIKKHTMWPQMKGLKLVKAQVKEAGLIGAALLARENQ